MVCLSCDVTMLHLFKGSIMEMETVASKYTAGIFELLSLSRWERLFLMDCVWFALATETNDL